MWWVGKVFNYIGCFTEAGISIDRVHEEETGFCDILSSVHNSLQFLVVSGRAVAIPNSNVS